LTRPDYVYILIEEGGDPSLVKIGHSVDPVNRPAGYKAGNYRKLLVLFTLIGGQPLEAEIHFRFEEYRIGSGGDEWYKLSPDMVSFFQHKLKEILSGDSVLVYHRPIGFDGPISIAPVELGEAKSRTAPPVSRTGSVRPHSIVEAEPPKSPYSKVGQKKAIK
jgi:hypothetical protein